MRELVDGEWQVFTLITPHNASSYPRGAPRPNTPALWSIRPQPKTPSGRKPWLAPNGTSGLYELDECATENGHVYQNGHDNNELQPLRAPGEVDGPRHHRGSPGSLI